MPEAPPSFGLRPLTPIVKITLVVLAAVFVLIAVQARILDPESDVRGWMLLVPAQVLEGRRLWTVVTYALVHDLRDPWNLIFDAMVLYFFGSDLETRWGKGRFVLFMLTTVLGGAAAAIVASALHLGGEVPGAVFGAAALCEGVVVAWGLLNRQQEAFLFFFRVKGITFVYVALGFAALHVLTGSPLFAAMTIGGIVVGFAWAGAFVGPLRRAYLQRKLKRLENERDAVVAAARRRSAASASGLRVIPGGRDDDGPKGYLN